MSEHKHYRVRFELQIMADSPEAALQEAVKISDVCHYHRAAVLDLNAKSEAFGEVIHIQSPFDTEEYSHGQSK